MKQDGEEEEDLPDHLRCSRSDGRQWRCVRRVMEDKKLCRAHYLQARHRQYKQKVPDSLKLQRKARPKRVRNEEPFDRSTKKCLFLNDTEKLKNLLKKKKRRRRRRRSVVLMKAATLDYKALLLELMRMFLRREMERKSKKRRRLESGICVEELLLDLPNGLMAISRAPAPSFRNAGFFCDRKLGLGLDFDSLLRRCIRSKNIEPLQFGSFKVVPYKRNIAGLKEVGKRNCHQCGMSDVLRLVSCSSCQRIVLCGLH